MLNFPRVRAVGKRNQNTLPFYSFLPVSYEQRLLGQVFYLDRTTLTLQGCLADPTWPGRPGRPPPGRVVLADLTRLGQPGRLSPGRVSLDDPHPAGSSWLTSHSRVGQDDPYPAGLSWLTSPGRVGLDDPHPAGLSWTTSPGRVVRMTLSQLSHPKKLK